MALRRRLSGLQTKKARIQVYRFSRETRNEREGAEIRERQREKPEACRDTFTCEKEKEREKEKRTHARTKDGSGVPYTVTFVKARLSPYTGNVRDGRHLYRVRLKSQECCFLSRLLYTRTHVHPLAVKQRRGEKGRKRSRVPAVNQR